MNNTRYTITREGLVWRVYIAGTMEEVAGFRVAHDLVQSQSYPGQIPMDLEER